jgi:regulator of protease activity HflC (stomatin/prohibitin superfamily)
MFPAVAIVAARKKATEKEEESRSPLESRAEKKQRVRDKAADSRRTVSEIGLLAFFLLLGATGIACGVLGSPVPIAFGFPVAFYFLFSLKVAKQWERAVVLRFGKFRGLKGPGLFAVIPVVDVVLFGAQTALRESIGKHMLAEMITERDQLGKDLQKILDDKTNPWGITVNSVEIRDVKIPPDLEDAMSRQAQAERERQARIILGTAETEISERFVRAGEAYEGHPLALHLRAMNMLYEAIKEKGSMVIVPSSAVETMGLGGLSGLTALGKDAPKG